MNLETRCHIILCREKETVPFLKDEIERNYSKDILIEDSLPLIKISPINAELEYLAFSTTALLNAIKLSEDSIGKQSKRVVEFVSSFNPIETQINCHVFSITQKHGIIETGRAELLKEKIVSSLRKENLFCLRKGFNRKLPFLQIAIMPDRTLTVSFLNEKEVLLYHSLISPYVGGFNNVEDDKKAPSRAYRKIVEAQEVMGVQISKEDLVVDLGASPGGWTYIARKYGAKVIALDRSPLCDDLMKDDHVQFIKGDAFKYRPDEKINWAISDIISTPERVLELLEFWATGENCQHFVFTIKFQGTENYSMLDQFKDFARNSNYQIILKKLNSNKNEVTIMGSQLDD